jgi:hypothetical protein
VHKIKSEFLIKKLSKKYPMKFDNNDIELDFSDEDDELVQEKKDKFDESILNNEKIFQKIKNLLFNHNKRYIIGNETTIFFKNKENKVNFLYDISILPNFRNNLLSNNNNSKFQQKLEEENYIENKTWRYLNIAKVRLQKIKDDKNFNEYVLCEEEKMLNKEKNNSFKEEETQDENSDDKKIKNKYEFYEIEDYISKKKENQSIVRIIDLKTKKLFYGTYIKMHTSN